MIGPGAMESPTEPILDESRVRRAMSGRLLDESQFSPSARVDCRAERALQDLGWGDGSSTILLRIMLDTEDFRQDFSAFYIELLSAKAGLSPGTQGAGSRATP